MTLDSKAKALTVQPQGILYFKNWFRFGVWFHATRNYLTEEGAEATEKKTKLLEYPFHAIVALCHTIWSPSCGPKVIVYIKHSSLPVPVTTIIYYDQTSLVLLWFSWGKACSTKDSNLFWVYDLFGFWWSVSVSVYKTQWICMVKSVWWHLMKAWNREMVSQQWTNKFVYRSVRLSGIVCNMAKNGKNVFHMHSRYNIPTRQNKSIKSTFLLYNKAKKGHCLC